jgi:DNA invertase Pin-like site-specific DNA recombinase
MLIGIAFDPLSASNIDPTQPAVNSITGSRFERCTGVNVGSRKEAKFGAAAQAVGRTISENTKTALAAAKARGVKLGNPNGARALRGKQAGNTEAVTKLKATAAQRAGDLKAIVDDIRRSGITTTRGIAEELHVRGIRAPRGETWHPTAVSRLLSRLSP